MLLEVLDTCNAGELGSVPGLGRSPEGRHGDSPQYFYLEDPMDRSLVDCSPWCLKESDTAEQLSTAQCHNFLTIYLLMEIWVVYN